MSEYNHFSTVSTPFQGHTKSHKLILPKRTAAFNFASRDQRFLAFSSCWTPSTFHPPTCAGGESSRHCRTWKIGFFFFATRWRLGIRFVGPVGNLGCSHCRQLQLHVGTTQSSRIGFVRGAIVYTRYLSLFTRIPLLFSPPFCFCFRYYRVIIVISPLRALPAVNTKHVCTRS